MRLTLPSAAWKRLTEAGIRCTPDVSLEYQRAANRYVLRGRESGGAVNELGRYVGFCGAEGEPLGWFLKPDSLAVNSDHAIVLAPSIASIEMFRYEHTYELLITRYRILECREEKRPKAASELVFRGWQGQLPLDLVTKDKALAGSIAPEFFDRAGEPRQLPARFAKPVQAITKAVNCLKCSHAHLLIEPESQARNSGAEAAAAVIAVNGEQPDISPGTAQNSLGGDLEHVSTAMLKEILERAEQKGDARVCALTSSDNVPKLHLLQRCGFLCCESTYDAKLFVIDLPAGERF